MKKIIIGWELVTNEKGIEMAILPADKLRNQLRYTEELENQISIIKEELKTVKKILNDPDQLAEYIGGM